MPMLACTKSETIDIGQEQIPWGLLPFFRIPGVVSADTVGADMGIASTLLPTSFNDFVQHETLV